MAKQEAACPLLPPGAHSPFSVRDGRCLQPLQRRSRGDRSRRQAQGCAWRGSQEPPGAARGQPGPGDARGAISAPEGEHSHVSSTVRTPLSIVCNKRKPKAERSALKPITTCQLAALIYMTIYTDLHLMQSGTSSFQSRIQVQLHVPFSEAPGW